MATDSKQTSEESSISGKWVSTFLADKPAVDLSEWVKQRRIEYTDFLLNCSPICIYGIWQCVAEYVLDEEVLIPNTKDADEFSKYWFVVPNGTSEINRFRQYHDVKVRPSDSGEYVEIELIRRGAIASINEYIPNKKAKLKIQCAVRWKDSSDFLTFLMRSDGKRAIDEQWGQMNHGGRVLRVVQHGLYERGWRSPGLFMYLGDPQKEWPSLTNFSAINNLPQPPYEGTLEIIDDGETVEMYYQNGNQYSLIEKRVSVGGSNRYHVAIYNREQPRCVSDITSLTVSVYID